MKFFNLKIKNVGLTTLAVAKYDYEPQRDDELRLRKGVKINVLVKSSDGWWKGEVYLLN